METYFWNTEEALSTNEMTMQDYLENHLTEHLGSAWEVIHEDGTYCEIQNKNTKEIYGLSASGNGDFVSHKIEFDFIR